MRRRSTFSLIAIAFADCRPALVPSPAATQVGCHRLQPTGFAVSTPSRAGWRKVVSDAAAMQAQVQPYAGTSTFVPLFDSGELDFGVVNAVDMGMVYRGDNLKSADVIHFLMSLVHG